MTRGLALVALLAALLGCEPVGPIPGGSLSGEVVATPVDDWSFAQAEETIQLETRPDDPYSVNLWFASQGGSLWIASGGGDVSTWAEHMIADPRVRLRIDGKIYERKATRVTDQSELDAVSVLYETKYEYDRDSDDADDAVLFRMDPR